MSDVKKPVDLVAIRARLDSTQSSGNAVNALLYHDVPAMADEIEKWRTLGADMIAGADGAHDGDREASRASAREVIVRMCALLPSS